MEERQDLISRQAAIDAIVNCTNCGDEKTLRSYVQKHNLDNGWIGGVLEAIDTIENLSSAQPEIIRCKDCKYGEQDDIGRWFCNDLGCQIGSEDGSGYCANAERKTDD